MCLSVLVLLVYVFSFCNKKKNKTFRTIVDSLKYDWQRNDLSVRNCWKNLVIWYKTHYEHTIFIFNTKNSNNSCKLKLLSSTKRYSNCGSQYSVKYWSKFVTFCSDEGHMYAFGSNYYGCLGLSDHGESEQIETAEEVHTPTLVHSLGRHQVAQLSCGDNHVVCLTEEGDVYTWGSGEFGKFIDHYNIWYWSSKSEIKP